MSKIALTGTSGKLGGAVLRALLDYDLVPATQLIVSTSSDPDDHRWDSFRQKGGTVRQASYDDQSSLEKAFAGCERLLLVSTPHINLDYNNTPLGSGREKHHFAAIQAAQKAGIHHLYYTSLGFKHGSKAGVMQAHNRTENYLQHITGLSYTIIREGLYNESWPLYLGYFKVPDEERKEIVVAGDGPIGWAAISDLGLATALIIVAPQEKYRGTLVTLASTVSYTLAQVAEFVSKFRGDEVNLRVVSRRDYEKYYIQDRHMDESTIKWWSTTYDALQANECLNHDCTLADLLREKGKELKPFTATLREMVLPRQG